MTVRRAPYCIRTSHNLITAQRLQHYADMARDGKLLGAALAGMDDQQAPLLELMGYLHYRPRDAHYFVSLLTHRLLNNHDMAP